MARPQPLSGKAPFAIDNIPRVIFCLRAGCGTMHEPHCVAAQIDQRRPTIVAADAVDK